MKNNQPQQNTQLTQTPVEPLTQIYTVDSSITHSNFSYFIVQAKEIKQNSGEYQCKTETDNVTFACTLLKISDKAQVGTHKTINVSYINSSDSVVKSSDTLTNNKFYVLRAPIVNGTEITKSNTTIIVSKTKDSTELAKLTILHKDIGKINDLKVNTFVAKRVSVGPAANNTGNEKRKTWHCQYDTNDTSTKNENCFPFEHKATNSKGPYLLSDCNYFEFIITRLNSNSEWKLTSSNTELITINLKNNTKKLSELKGKQVTMFVKEKTNDSWPTNSVLTTAFARGIIGTFSGDNKTVFFFE